MNSVFRPESSPWQDQVIAVARRYDQEYRGQAFDVPPEVEAMPLFREWVGGQLAAKVASPFWELAKPQKKQRILDLGCGISFLVYPWREWDAWFYGQEISAIAQQALTSRGPQLNSKLFKGVKLAPAHQLDYEPQQFDTVIATGFSCYYPLAYWETVLTQVKPVLKPGGTFVFDVVDPDLPLAESWAILETYLGAEVLLEDLADWRQLIKQVGGKVAGQQAGEIFHLFKVKF